MRRTLKRHPAVRPVSDDDIRYLWAAYRKGGIPTAKEYDSAAEFHNEVIDFLLDNYDSAWIVETDTAKGRMPVGLILGIVAGRMLLVGDVKWFPWASSRNVIEGFIQFIVDHRDTQHIVGYCEMKDMDFFNHMARHGVIRRVGTLYPLDGTKLAYYEARKMEH